MTSALTTINRLAALLDEEDWILFALAGDLPAAASEEDLPVACFAPEAGDPFESWVPLPSMSDVPCAPVDREQMISASFAAE